MTEISPLTENLFEQLPLGFALHEAVYDETGKPVDYIFLKVNPTFEEILGLRNDEVQGKRVTEVLPGTEKDPADWIGTYGRLAQTQEHIQFEQYAKALNKWFMVTAFSPEKGKFAVLFEEITEKKIEFEVLRNNEKRLYAILNAAEGVPIQGFDQDHQVIFWNMASEKLYGFTKQEALGKKYEELLIPPDKRLKVENEVTRWFDSGGAIPSGEMEVMDSMGRVIPIFSSHVVIESSSRAKELYSIDFDIRDRKFLEEKRLQALKLDSLGMVAGGIAHNFNNLLTGLFGMIDLSKLCIPEGHESLLYLEQASSALDTAKQLTGQLLTFAKGGNPVLGTLLLQDLIPKVVKFHLIGSNVAVTFDVDEYLWPVDADENQIEQVLSNLTINAKQAMPDGGRLWVKVENTYMSPKGVFQAGKNKVVKITFRDEGMGIPPNAIQNIFDPYFTTKSNGSGLGLAVTHSIINKHGGSIDVVSTEGEGTTFNVYLPVAKMDHKKENQNGSISDANATELSHARILIMDDEKILLNLISSALERTGCIVGKAEDGQEAVDQYRTAKENGTPYDIVIMDLTVPGGMGGKEAMQKILLIDPQAKGVVSSGYSSDSAVANYEAHGFCGAINKPYRIDALKSELIKILNEPR